MEILDNKKGEGMFHIRFGSRRPRLHTRRNILWGVGGDVIFLILVYVHLTFYKIPTWISQIRYLCNAVKPD